MLITYFGEYRGFFTFLYLSLSKLHILGTSSMHFLWHGYLQSKQVKVRTAKTNGRKWNPDTCIPRSNPWLFINDKYYDYQVGCSTKLFTLANVGFLSHHNQKRTEFTSCWLSEPPEKRNQLKTCWGETNCKKKRKAHTFVQIYVESLRHLI